MSNIIPEIGQRLNGPLVHHYRILAASFCILLFALVAETSVDRVQLLGFQLPPVCAFRLITGLDCPGCGLTRAVILAAHGSFWQSYLMHIWGIPLVFLLLFQVPYRISMILARRTTYFRSRPTVLRWISHFVVLSLLLPWGVKTILLIANEIGRWV